MAHFAKIENNIVKQVIVIDNQYENDGQNYINNTLNLEGEWIQTSYNRNIRANFAGIGFTYDRENDVFIPVQPFSSWILNSDYMWQAPVPYPNDEKYYTWDEESTSWIEYK